MFTIKERKEEQHTSFRATARLKRDRVTTNIAPKIVSVLMDPGAELNLIRTEALNAKSTTNRKIKVHAREPTDVVLMNNGVEIGRVTEAVYLSFTLDNVDGTQSTYHEWCYSWSNMHEEMILGTAFCRDQGFTSFHTRLAPWSESYSNCRPKRTRQVEQVNTLTKHALAKIAARCENLKCPYESHDDDEVELCRKRERVTTTCEKIDEHIAHHSQQTTAPTAMRAGRRIATKKIFAPQITPKEHCRHVPVNYNGLVCKQVANILIQKAAMSRNNLVSDLKELAASNVQLTMDEMETLRDTSRMCAAEAAKAYLHHQELLGTKVETFKQVKEQRYFMNYEAPTPVATAEATSSKQRFRKGQCVVLQNLNTQFELNGKAARIVSYDDETEKYVVSIAEPLGYWYAREDKLKSLDPPPEKDDYTACGIDMNTGQPTLDPLAKPAHRQYGNQFSPALTAKINELLAKYAHVFGKDITTPCKFKPMKIELVPGANLPRNPRYWNNSPAQRAEVRKQLQGFLDMGIVRPSQTSIVSNVLLVKRPGMPGKFRFTIDFRELNDATVSAPWQMPDVASQLERLAGNQIFGCIDLSSYYHQIELDEGSRFLTGFVTEDGVFEYTRVAMGLKCACAHAQGQLQLAIDNDPILSKFGLRNYFDDLPLAAKTEDEFAEQLEAVLRLGEQFSLKFNLEKSVFGVDSITHVGFVVNKDGVQVDPQRIQSLKEVEVPKSMKAVQSVLGIWNYIRHFIPNFSTRALPLTNLVGHKKRKTFLWTDECQSAFDDLKAATLDTKLLANMDYSKPIYIRCDSSQYGAGAVLFQFDEHGQERPISYASRKYTIAERNYCTFQQEAAAVVWSLEKFSAFHQGYHVTVQSDHKNLSWIKKTAMPQLTRWRLRLQDFDFSLEYYPGEKNVVADGLSRKYVDDNDINISIRDFLPEHAAQQSFLQGSVPVRCLNEYSAVSFRDRKLTAAERIWENKETKEPVSSDNEASDETHLPSCYHTDDDSDEDYDTTPVSEQQQSTDLQHANVAPIAAQQAELPAIPNLEEESPEQIFNQMHNCTVGHAGVLVTLNRVLRANKGWADRNQMIKQIDQFLSGCAVCQKFRKRHNRRTDERFVIEGNPFSELSVDILKLPKRDCNNNLYVVVVVDSFSRWVSLEPAPDKSALAAARAILRTVGNFGVPLTIRSDGGREFINDTLSSIEFLLNVQHHKISPYHHEGNSLAEKANRSVLENLRNIIWDKRYVLNGKHQWSDLLPLVQRIMNASFNSSIGCAPAELLFGNNIDLDRCLLRPQPARMSGQTVPEYVEQLTHNQQIVYDAAARTLHETHAKSIAKWRKTHKDKSKLRAQIAAAAADEDVAPVWVLARVKDDVPLEKWNPRWSGPFRLLDFKTDSDCILRLFNTVTQTVIEAHINDVELWDGLFVSSEEGMTVVAETDNWQYPMDAIMGMALDPEDDDITPVALPLDVARTNSNKHKYLFAVKWRGYPEPSWEPYRAVKDTSTFELFASEHRVLRLI